MLFPKVSEGDYNVFDWIMKGDMLIHPHHYNNTNRWKILDTLVNNLNLHDIENYVPYVP